EMRPGIDVARRVADYRRLAGGARGGVDAHDALHWYGKHAEGIRLAQIRFGREWESPQILEALAIAGLDVGGVEFAPVVRHVFIRVLERPLQALKLQPRQLLTRRLFYRLEFEHAHSTQVPLTI